MVQIYVKTNVKQNNLANFAKQKAKYMLYIRIFDDMESLKGERLARLIDSLPQWRREQAMKFRYESGRRECAMAYRLLTDILSENLGIAGQPEFVTGKHGKPMLKGMEHIHFNLSHCSRAVCCAVSDRPVGIDVENTGRYKESLARYVLSDNEMQRILCAQDTDLEFTRLWTQKEAVFKLTGEGITDDIKSILEQSPASAYTLHTETRDGYVVTISQSK